MPTMELVTDIVIGPVRLSYANIWAPKAINDDGEEKYSVSLIIDKSDAAAIKKIEDATEAAIQKGIDRFGKSFKSGKLKEPLRDGDVERPEDENYANAHFLNANSPKSRPPKIYDLYLNLIEDEDAVYSGCYARASLSFYPFNTRGNKGVAVALNGLQKVKDGEPLCGRVDVHEAFNDGFEPEFDDDDDFLK